MKKASSAFPLAVLSLSIAGGLCTALPALAQVAGGTTSETISVMETTRLALGWSVKKTLLGKTIYNEAGDKVGKVQDLIIAPDKNLSYVIVGAGGFIGIGRHDVAIRVSRIEDKNGRLVMAGATKESIKAMSTFTYADNTSQRDQFVARAELDIANGKARITELQAKSAEAAADAKVGLDAQVSALKLDVASAESRLTELKLAAAARWREFEAGVSDATARVRKAIDKTAH